MQRTNQLGAVVKPNHNNPKQMWPVFSSYSRNERSWPLLVLRWLKAGIRNASDWLTRKIGSDEIKWSLTEEGGTRRLDVTRSRRLFKRVVSVPVPIGSWPTQLDNMNLLTTHAFQAASIIGGGKQGEDNHPMVSGGLGAASETQQQTNVPTSATAISTEDSIR